MISILLLVVTSYQYDILIVLPNGDAVVNIRGRIAAGLFFYIYLLPSSLSKAT